jgi:hypothetical protein
LLENLETCFCRIMVPVAILVFRAADVTAYGYILKNEENLCQNIIIDCIQFACLPKKLQIRLESISRGLCHSLAISLQINPAKKGMTILDNIRRQCVIICIHSLTFSFCVVASGLTFWLCSFITFYLVFVSLSYLIFASPDYLSRSPLLCQENRIPLQSSSYNYKIRQYHSISVFIYKLLCHSMAISLQINPAKKGMTILDIAMTS